MYPKNTASPRNLYARVVKASDGSAITSGVAAYHVQGTTRGAGGGTLTHIDGGLWRYLPTQAETNHDAFAIEFYHADAVAGGPVVNVVTSAKLVSDLNDYDGSDTAGTTTLLSRIVGTLDTGTHKPQSGDAYAVVNHGTHGNAALLARGDAAWTTATGFSTLTTADIDARLAAWGKTGFALHATTGWGGAALPTQFEASNMRGTDDAALAATALSNATWTNAKAAFLDAAITSRHASGAAVAKSPATLAAGDVTGNLPADVRAWDGGALPTIGTSTLTAQQVWEYATRTLSANTNLGLPASWPASWPANWNWSTYAGADTAGTTRLLGLVEDSDGDRFTAKALEQAPAGTGGGDDAAAVYAYFTTESRADAFKADATAANQAAALAVLNKLGFTADGDNWRVNSQVLGMANNVITSSAIATDAINSGAVATSAAQEIAGWVYRLPEGHAGYAATKAVMDQIAAATGGLAGSGGIETTITVQVGGNPVDGVAVWITTDAGGADVVAGTLHTNAQGQVTFMLEAGSYYAWRQKSGVNFTNPYAITVNE